MSPRSIRRRPRTTVSFHAHLHDYMSTAFGAEFHPMGKATVVAQSTDKTKLKAAPTASGAGGDGMDYPVVVPYFTPQMTDSTGAAMPGGPVGGDDLHIIRSDPRSPMVIGRRLSTPVPLPFVADVVVGNGIARSEYADPLVIKPTLSVQAGNGIAVGVSGVAVKAKGSAGTAATAGGLAVDTAGLALSLATNPGLSVASGLAVLANTGSTPATGVAGGIDVGASGLGVSLAATNNGLQSTSGLAVRLQSSGGIAFDVAGALKIDTTAALTWTGIHTFNQNVTVNATLSATSISAGGCSISGGGAAGAVAAATGTISLTINGASYNLLHT
jgi:hypothetical protein